MRVRMKNLMGVMQGGSIPALSNLEEALKTEQKVLIFLHFWLKLLVTYYLLEHVDINAMFSFSSKLYL